MFIVHDEAPVIGVLPYYCFFEYECAPGRHRFSATVEDEMKVLEAELLPDRIYYAKVSARYGFGSPGVNMYSLYPGCPGELWPQMSKMLGELKEAIVDPAEVEKRGAPAQREKNSLASSVNSHRYNAEK